MSALIKYHYSNIWASQAKHDELVAYIKDQLPRLEKDREWAEGVKLTYPRKIAEKTRKIFQLEREKESDPTINEILKHEKEKNDKLKRKLGDADFVLFELEELKDKTAIFIMPPADALEEEEFEGQQDFHTWIAKMRDLSKSINNDQDQNLDKCISLMHEVANHPHRKVWTTLFHEFFLAVDIFNKHVFEEKHRTSSSS